jgi:hypothetical protein
VCKSHPIIRISASFGPSTVRVNTETVYSDRREVGVVMTSTGQVIPRLRLFRHPIPPPETFYQSAVSPKLLASSVTTRDERAPSCEEKC